MTVVGLVGARSGSKGIPGKNVRPFEGHPLLAWSVAAGCLCDAIDRVVVSTDAQELADVAVRYGAEAPFLRPAAISGDQAVDVEYVLHAIEALGMTGTDTVVLLRPTTPVRDPAVVGEAIELLLGDDEASSVCSVHELPEPPQKMLRLEGDYLVRYVAEHPNPESFNLPRQTFPPAYHPNGVVDVLRVSSVLEHGLLYGPRIRAFVTEFVLDLDRPEDYEYNAQRARREAGEIRAFLERQVARSRR